MTNRQPPNSPEHPLAEPWTTRDRFLLATLFVGVLLAYLPALGGGFIWNDSDYVTAPALRSFAGLFRIWFEVGATEQYYPLLHSAFWVEHQLWGDAPSGYHLLNVLLHATNAFLFVVLLRQLALQGAWLAGFLFALHPVCVESVGWIAEQKNTLSTVFYLLAAIAYVRFDAHRRRRDYWVALAWFVAALLTKSVTATLVGALLVTSWWRRGKLEWRMDFVPLIPWAVLGAAAGTFTGWVEKTILRAEGGDFALSLLERTLLAGRVVWFYLGKLVWPSELIFIYPKWEINIHEAWQYVFSPLLLAVIFAFWLLRHKFRTPLTVLLLFIGVLFPTSGFFNIYGFLFSYVADHWQYLPSLAFFAAAGGIICAVLDRLPAGRQWLGFVPVVAGLTLLAGLSWRQSGLYKDIESFYEKTLAANPNCWMAINNLGNLYSDRQDWSRATEYYEKGLRLKPDRFELHHNFGLALVKLERWQDAINHFERAIQANPRSFVSYFNIGTILRMSGQNEAAAKYYLQALHFKPDYNDARNNLGLVLGKLGRQDEALRTLEESLRLDPNDAEAHNIIGLTLTAAGRFPEAENHFLRALALRPDLAGAYDNLGNSYRKAGRIADAATQYQKALALSPNSAITLVNLTLALSDLGRHSEAVAHGERAIKLSPNLAEAHFNLAIALMGAERLSEARQHYQIARQLKPTLQTVPRLEAPP